MGLLSQKAARSAAFFISLDTILLTVLIGCGGGGASAPTANTEPVAPVSTPSQTASAPSTQSPIEHVVVVLLQNSSFDHLFGTFPGAEGIRPGIPGYTQADAAGKSVTPFLLADTTPAALPEGRAKYLADWNNGGMDKFAAVEGDLAMGYYDSSTPGVSALWSWAQQYALADHYFQSVFSEAPTNQLFLVAASDNHFPYSVQPSFGPCQLADSASKPLSLPSVADQLAAKGLTWGVYAQDLGNCTYYNAEHNPFQYLTSTQGSANIQDYSGFASALQQGTLPAFSLVIPNNRTDMHPGGGSVTNAVAFLQTLVSAVQSSSAWSSTAIIITFDDSGGWYDHVNPPQIDAEGLGFRVPTLVISPYAKRGYISHVTMDHTSILRFVQWNWSLPALNTRNNAVADIRDMLKF